MLRSGDMLCGWGLLRVGDTAGRNVKGGTVGPTTQEVKISYSSNKNWVYNQNTMTSETVIMKFVQILRDGHLGSFHH